MHEDKDAVKAFADAIKVEKYVETFDDMPHVSTPSILTLIVLDWH